MLNRAGAFPRLEVDGDFGPKTKAALLAFQAEKELEQTGVMDVKTVSALRQYATVSAG